MADDKTNTEDGPILDEKAFKRFKKEDGSAREVEGPDDAPLPLQDILDDTFEELVKEEYLERLGLIRKAKKDDAESQKEEDWLISGIRRLHCKDTELQEGYEKFWTAPKAVLPHDADRTGPVCPATPDPYDGEDEEEAPAASSITKSPWRMVPRMNRGAALIRSPPTTSIWEPVPEPRTSTPVSGVTTGRSRIFGIHNLTSFNWVDLTRTPKGNACSCHEGRSTRSGGSKSQ